MDSTPDPYDGYSPETLLRRKGRECVELRELLTPVAQELEHLACEHPELARRGLLVGRPLRGRRVATAHTLRPVVTTAILDRLLHHSHVLTIRGESSVTNLLDATASADRAGGTASARSR